MRRIIFFILTLIVVFLLGCSKTSEPDYWSDLDARVEEYILDKEGGNEIPEEYYAFCIDMMKEAQKEMGKHEDGPSFSYYWNYIDRNAFGMQVINLICSTESDDHFMSVMISSY